MGHPVLFPPITDTPRPSPTQSSSQCGHRGRALPRTYFCGPLCHYFVDKTSKVTGPKYCALLKSLVPFLKLLVPPHQIQISWVRACPFQSTNTHEACTNGLGQFRTSRWNSSLGYICDSTVCGLCEFPVLHYNIVRFGLLFSGKREQSIQMNLCSELVCAWKYKILEELPRVTPARRCMSTYRGMKSEFSI